VGLSLFVAFASAAEVEAQIPGLDEWAQVVAEGQTRRWVGPRVDEPAPADRPEATLAARSTLRPVAVHAADGVDADTVERALGALERAYDTLSSWGWDDAPFDGGRGGTSDLDLYLAPTEREPDDAIADARVLASWLDAASAFAVVDPSVAPDDLEACVLSAYAQAVLLGQDPAEAREVRRATATYLVFAALGRFGCDESAVTVQQRELHRSWMRDGAGGGSAGAMYLARLSERHAEGDPYFVRDVWQIARQRTWEGDGLRASPDLWEAVEAAVGLTSDRMDAIAGDLAADRWFTGARRAGAQGFLHALPTDATPEAFATYTWDELPKHSPSADPPLEPYGSGYVRVDVSGAPTESRLRLWLRGEFGVRWSFVAIRLDENGRELGRMIAPPRRRPDSYLLLELVPGTKEVIVAVTNLSSDIPDADHVDPTIDARSFKVIVDRWTEADGEPG
jgi:hypothetical protein